MRLLLPSKSTGPGRPFVTALSPRRAGVVVAVTHMMILAAAVLVKLLRQGDRLMMAMTLPLSDALSM